MKKNVVLIALILLGFMAGNTKASPNNIDKLNFSEGIPIRICITFEIGRPKKNCEFGLGICKFHISLDNGMKSGLAVNEAVADVYFDESDHFVAEFKKDLLRDETLDSYFNNVFVVEEQIDIPQDVMDALERGGRYTIEAGRYIVEDNGDIITVRF
ncbi:MAG: hypothetical protein KAT48_12815 [Bacteroidales bacterium]|nr:hypothetical protein [Bacteroidales bacterium]